MKITSNRDADVAIRARQPFRSHTGSLHGRPVGVAHDAGRLPEPWRAKYHASSPVYVVWSYGTPIGWVLADGETVVSDVKYSVTTSRHQGIVRRAL